ncbi:MAG: carbamoyl-phosphate synthase large subunit, partial [Candidatus Aminicenantales bacterium]
ILGPAKELQALGFAIMATRGTAEFLKANGIDARIAYRLNEHRAPNLLEIIRERKVHLIINTPTMTSSAKRDGYTMRRLAVEMNIPFLTAINSVKAEIEAIKALRRGGLGVRSLNDYYAEIRSS